MSAHDGNQRLKSRRFSLLLKFGHESTSPHPSNLIKETKSSQAQIISGALTYSVKTLKLTYIMKLGTSIKASCLLTRRERCSESSLLVPDGGET